MLLSSGTNFLNELIDYDVQVTGFFKIHLELIFKIIFIIIKLILSKNF